MITKTYPVEVGRLIARSVERELRAAAMLYELDVVIERDLGWLDGYLYVTVIGEQINISRFQRAGADMVRRYNS